MFSDARRYRALRQALVLDANNHFEGYTNSDGVGLMAGKRPRPSTYCTPPRLLTVAPTPHAPQDDGLPDCRLIRRARHVVRHRNRLWRAAVPPNPLPAVSCCAARPGLPGDDDGPFVDPAGQSTWPPISTANRPLAASPAEDEHCFLPPFPECSSFRPEAAAATWPRHTLAAPHRKTAGRRVSATRSRLV